MNTLKEAMETIERVRKELEETTRKFTPEIKKALEEKGYSLRVSSDGSEYFIRCTSRYPFSSKEEAKTDWSYYSVIDPMELINLLNK